jgi:uncharacterized protein (DUF2147 family)
MLTNHLQPLHRTRSGSAAKETSSACGKALQTLMIRTGRLCAAVAVIGVAGSGSHQAIAQLRPPEPLTVIGVWIDDTGQGAVEIAPCGDRLCGRVVWLKQQADSSGRPVTDANNPDPTRRSRPVCGLPVIGNLARQQDGSWDGGWIYDPKEGKSYDVEVRLSAPDRLRVTGYLGVKFLSESFLWTRAPTELARCQLLGQSL